MNLAISASKITQMEIPLLLRNVTAVVALVVDDQGIVMDANRGFLTLANKESWQNDHWNARDLFIQPTFSDFTSVNTEQPEDPVYQGILNIGDSDGACHSVIGRVYRFKNRLLIIAEHDIADLQGLNETVINLNDELAQTQRELVKANLNLKRNEKKITELMLTDPLTGIPNRRSFDQRILEEIKRHHREKDPLCLAMADIDHFKNVNDTYGHDVGDKVICGFADVINENKRASDFVARIGGEEFMVLLTNTDAEQGFLYIDRMRKLFFEEPSRGIDKPISASFGITCLQENDTVDSLVKRVDEGLYEAKETGRNKVVLQVLKNRG